jgi:membrane fusion protein (multidrug efflux system)
MYCRVTAPISGRIGKSTVTEGAVVTAYQSAALATISQLDPVYVDVPQASAEMLGLKRSLLAGAIQADENNPNSVYLILEDNTAYPHEGRLKFSDVTVDPTTGSVTLRLVFPNPDGMLLPGMFVRARVKEGINDQAILIPQQSVSRDHKGNPMAMVVTREDTVALRSLVLDRAIEAQWLVSSGLKAGDRLILEGLQMLRPGMSVTAKPFVASGAGPDSQTGQVPLSHSAKDGGA